MRLVNPELIQHRVDVMIEGLLRLVLFDCVDNRRNTKTQRHGAVDGPADDRDCSAQRCACGKPCGFAGNQTDSAADHLSAQTTKAGGRLATHHFRAGVYAALD